MVAFGSGRLVEPQRRRRGGGRRVGQARGGVGGGGPGFSGSTALGGHAQGTRQLRRHAAFRHGSRRRPQIASVDAANREGCRLGLGPVPRDPRAGAPPSPANFVETGAGLVGHLQQALLPRHGVVPLGAAAAYVARLGPLPKRRHHGQDTKGLDAGHRQAPPALGPPRRRQPGPRRHLRRALPRRGGKGGAGPALRRQSGNRHAQAPAGLGQRRHLPRQRGVSQRGLHPNDSRRWHPRRAHPGATAGRRRADAIGRGIADPR
mmetsp:Transcript_65649/g.183580  ORF Transcript_65649/g.183580 Transcript_65649/m.183580 type:complete len:262 (+) Transcript_65649:177-962(+)